MVLGEQNYYEVLTEYVDSGTTYLGQKKRARQTLLERKYASPIKTVNLYQARGKYRQRSSFTKRRSGV